MKWIGVALVISALAVIPALTFITLEWIYPRGAVAHYAQYPDAIHSTMTIGGGTAITQLRVYTPSLTPTQIAAAIGAAEQTFTVTGLTTADKVIVNPPSFTVLCPMAWARVSGADTLALGFSNLAIALCTPAAGTYTVVAIRS